MMTLRWAVGRILIGLVTVVGITIVVFLIARAVPGSVAATLLGPLASEEAKAALTQRLGLDRDLVSQYGMWLASMLRGDFGVSAVSGVPVVEELARRLPTTGLIAVLALGAALLIGVPLGILQALHARRASLSVPGRIISGLAISVPEFVLGSLVVFIASSLGLGALLGAGASGQAGGAPSLGALLLPAAVLAVFPTGATARTTRDAVLDVLVEPYIQAAVARGSSPWSIIRHHVLRNAAIPVLTLLATLLAYLLGGAVIVETMFNVPGLGSYLMSALGRRDYQVVQAGVTLSALVFVGMSLLVELASGWIDPRVARTGGAR